MNQVKTFLSGNMGNNLLYLLAMVVAEKYFNPYFGQLTGIWLIENLAW